MELENSGRGVWVAPGARIIDRSGRRRLPIGYEGFADAMSTGVIVDKTMLIADVLSFGYKATLFCRPRRFGKTLNLTMLRSFLEKTLDGAGNGSLFEGTLVWEADGGRYRQYLGAYPVVHVSLNTCKGLSWVETRGAIARVMAAEYLRHDYLRKSGDMPAEDLEFFGRVASARASEEELADSLASLCRMLRLRFGTSVVLLVDEYDSPVMSGYTNGYYDEAVGFLKRWLTGAIKDGGESLAFACLTGVQRVTKESIFSDLNNLVVDTPLTTRFDERFGFTQEEVEALASYLGYGDEASVRTAREWYDGYHFGRSDVYNPWSVLNYLDNRCEPDTYWANTSSNGVIGQAVAQADDETLGRMYALMEPGGTVVEPLELGVVFPDVGIREGALWSMLYMAGYLTTDDTALPNNAALLRRLRIPNKEMRTLFSGEIVNRFRRVAGGTVRLSRLHRSLITGDDGGLVEELGRILRDSASSFDLTSENSFHMLLLGLLFGVPGYHDPVSNRESGYGRPDVQLVPDESTYGLPTTYIGARPLITIETKFRRPAASSGGGNQDQVLATLAEETLAQIAARGYDEGSLPVAANGRMRWGIAVCGRHIRAVSSTA